MQRTPQSSIYTWIFALSCDSFCNKTRCIVNGIDRMKAAYDRTPIIGFLGRRGSGKTLLMSIFAQVAHQQGDKLFSNYSLDGAERMDKAFLRSFFDTKGEAFLRGRDATICIDELPTFLDAYDFRSKAAKIFSYFILQTRKRGVSLYYTAQQLHLVPIRVRNNTDLLIHPTYDKAKDVIVYTIHHYRPPRVITYKTLTILKASRFFSLYDSNEIIDVLDK